MPKRLIVGFVSSDAVNSSIHRNPFNFQHYNVSNIMITSDSQTQIRPVKTDYKKNLYLQAYLSLFECCGIYFTDTGNAIKREDYPHGYALTGIDLSEDLSASSNHWALPRQGSLRIDLQFATPLPEAVTVLVYAEFDSLIEIDKNRAVSLDYPS